jgi:hypothetical protein
MTIIKTGEYSNTHGQSTHHAAERKRSCARAGRYFSTATAAFQKTAVGIQDVSIRQLNVTGAGALKSLDIFVNVSRLFSPITLFFSLLSLGESGVTIRKALRDRNFEGAGLEGVKIIGTISKVADKAISASLGITGLLLAGGRAALSAGAQSLLATAGRAVPGLNLVIGAVGLVESSIGMHHVRKAAKQIKAVQEDLQQLQGKDPNKITQKEYENLQKKIDQAIGLTEDEEKAIPAKVDKLAKLVFAVTRKKLDKAAMIENMKKSIRTQKEARFKRSTSEKALLCMQKLREDLSKQASITEMKVRVFTDMRKLVQRQTFCKAMSLLDNIVLLICSGLYYTPIAPFIPLFTETANLLLKFSVGLYEKFGLEKGLNLDYPPPEK